MPTIKPDGSGDTPCERYLRSLLGLWRTEQDDGMSKPAPNTLPTIDVNYHGMSATFFRVAEHTSHFFIHTDMVTWPKGKEGSRGMHYEAGYLRCTDPTSLAWGLSSSTGAGESLVGKLHSNGISATFTSRNKAPVSFPNSTDGSEGPPVLTERRVTAYKGQLQYDLLLTPAEGGEQTQHIRTFMNFDEAL